MTRIGLTVLHIVAVVVARGRISAGATLPEVTALSPNEYFGGSDNESYMTWHNEHGPSYTGCLYLEADGEDALSEGLTNRNGVAVHWRVNETEELLYLSFAARAQDGWIGFGMAEAGGMSGADIVIYETSKPDTLTDAYVLRQPQPLIDDCQDWQFVSSFNEGGFLIVEGVRKFNTNDTQDRVVINDAEQFVVAQKVIAAWGNDTDTMTYHGKKNRARGALRWFGIDDEATSFQRQMMEEATGYFDLSFANYSIKPNDTEYAVFCFDWNAHVVSQGLGTNENVALIAVDVIPDPTTKEFLHHVSFLASPKWHNESNVCQFADPDLEQIYLYGWTFGSSPFRLPTDVGLTLGPGEIEGFQRFKCEVHYNNPKMIEGMRDNSKLRVYYSTNLRKYELGMALMADFSVQLNRQPIYTGLSKYTFDCSEQCSVLVLDEPVNVVAEVFHMHNVGSAGVNYQIRNGDIVRQSNVDYFDFNQAGKEQQLSFLALYQHNFPWRIFIFSLFHCSGPFFRNTCRPPATFSNLPW
jgi:DOMON domain/Copper type II ascorbate-dependent monooxygenase, N-terminal domain